MSAPNLMVWLPWERVQLFTTWNCCSLSVRGQLQRAILRPLPKLENMPGPPTSALPFLLIKKPDKPPVEGRPAIPEAQFVFGSVLTVFRHGNPRVSSEAEPWSEYAVFGLYLKYPKRTSVSHLVPIGLVTPVA